ncbi:hypothetical protein LX81_01118 [Palleronia aestuarii]|uniref:DUF6456 domain-containing protein n=2 Tax=Palleronia aestuarii TaxID=568105 RepID=A0A2W7NPE0_9RHOB|nr:hypothetical protein LX81_01118 [Palleronia aestuarii]
MTTNTETTSMPSEEVIALEARRILRRLSEPGACLAVAEGMEKAVVVRETKDGQTIRTGVCDSKVAEALALKEWIAASGTGRIARYRIKPAGRSALKHLLAEEGETGEADAGTHAKAPPTARYNHFESPLLTLARRRDKDGELFLSDALVRAGERMREDFELARMSAGGERDWHEFLLSAGSKDTAPDIEPLGTSPEAAGRRLADALTDLGPGLGDVVLRVCCHLEGMETVERRMGWAARSGKIVLRIGLQRLQRHYLERYGNLAPMIG